MKLVTALLLACLSAAWAQTTPTPAAVPASAPNATLPDLPDETVIATMPDGSKMTMGQYKSLYGALPPQMQQMAIRAPKDFLNEYSLMKRLTKMAEDEGVDKQSPYKEALEFSKLFTLSQAQMLELNKTATVEPAEITRHYEANRDKYKEVRVKAIYIGFGKSGETVAGKKTLKEEDAKAKANKLLAQLRAGADFVKLVKENSDDETSREKDGDFANLRLTDTIPDAIREAVFSLNKGDLSNVVAQPNGFYIFRAEEVTMRPLSQVRDEIFSQMKQQRYQETMDRLVRESKVTDINPALLGQRTPGSK